MNRLALPALTALALAGCSSLPALTFSGAREAAPAGVTAAAGPNDTVFDPETCPTVEIAPDGAALRSYAGAQGQADSLARQVSLGELARECILQGNSVRVRVGARGRVLLGPRGAAGAVPVAVKFEARRVDKLYASKVERTSVTVGAGNDSVPFSIVSELVVPVEAVTGELELLVSLDTAGANARPAGRGARR